MMMWASCYLVNHSPRAANAHAGGSEFFPCVAPANAVGREAHGALKPNQRALRVAAKRTI